MIDFQTDPGRYRHWRLRFDGPVAFLDMDVDPSAGLHEGYEMKLNSYDLVWTSSWPTRFSVSVSSIRRSGR